MKKYRVRYFNGSEETVNAASANIINHTPTGMTIQFFARARGAEVIPGDTVAVLTDVTKVTAKGVIDEPVRRPRTAKGRFKAAPRKGTPKR